MSIIGQGKNELNDQLNVIFVYIYKIRSYIFARALLYIFINPLMQESLFKTLSHNGRNYKHKR